MTSKTKAVKNPPDYVSSMLRDVLEKRIDLEDPLTFTIDEMVEAVEARMTMPQRRLHRAQLEIDDITGYNMLVDGINIFNIASLRYVTVQQGMHNVLIHISTANYLPAQSNVQLLAYTLFTKDFTEHTTALDRKLWKALLVRWPHVKWAAAMTDGVASIAERFKVSGETTACVLSPAYAALRRFECKITDAKARKIEDTAGSEMMADLDEAVAEAVQLMSNQNRFISYVCSNFKHVLA